MRVFKDTEQGKYLTTPQVAERVGVSTKTLNNWYKYYVSDSEKPANMPELPMYIQKVYRGLKLWKPEDIDKIIAFKEWIPRGKNGVMADISSRYWSATTKEALVNAKLKRAQKAKTGNTTKQALNEDIEAAICHAKEVYHGK